MCTVTASKAAFTGAARVATTDFLNDSTSLPGEQHNTHQPMNAIQHRDPVQKHQQRHRRYAVTGVVALFVALGLCLQRSQTIATDTEFEAANTASQDAAARPVPNHVIWIEGETPTSIPAGFAASGWGKADFLSSKSWLHARIDAAAAASVPEQGVVLEYPFSVMAAGEYELWTRIGFEFARSPMEVRIDTGEWTLIDPQTLTSDLMAIDDWAEVAWLKTGKHSLKPGIHRLQVQFLRPGSKRGKTADPETLLAGIDCFCLSTRPFKPNGPYRPDDEWRTAEDVAAAETAFSVKEPASAGARSSLNLAGRWQVARWDEQELVERDQPTKALPDGYKKLFWKSIAVPGNRDDLRPDLQYAHRLIYRTQFDVPVALAGKSFVLRFPSTSLIASLFINGQFCRGNSTAGAAWSADVTQFVEAGKRNEIAVVIKDVYYALEQDGSGRSARYLFNLPPSQFYNSGGLGVTRFADFPVLFQVRGSGLLETPSLEVCGPVYTTDVFCKPSLREKKLGLEISIRNNKSTQQFVDVDLSAEPIPTVAEGKGGDAGNEIRSNVLSKDIGTRRITVPANAETTFRFSESWENPRLWWPDEPRQYAVKVDLVIAREDVDEMQQSFGFREWDWTGNQFRLNGIPWSLQADLEHNGPRKSVREADAAVADWRSNGQNMFRFWGLTPWVGGSQAETLDFFDTRGVIVRRTGTFDGQVASYLLVQDRNGRQVPRRKLFANWLRHLEAMIRAERNHPSICVWSLENEIVYINTRNFGWLDAVEPEVKLIAERLMQLDPTRPVMLDGGDALRDRSLPIYGNHYVESNLREYPDEAYTFDLAKKRHEVPGAGDPWPIDDSKPLFLGESFFAMGRPPAAYAEVAGDAAFLGRPQSRAGVGVIARMLAEGYRYKGVAATHFWFDGESADRQHYQAWQPLAVLAREWNGTFAPGTTLTRTLKVFNSTRFPETLKLVVLLTAGDAIPGEYRTELALAAGESRELSISLNVPKVEQRTDGELRLTLLRESRPIFRDVKPIAVLPADSVPTLPDITAKNFWVLDPTGSSRQRLEQRSIAFSTANTADEIPDSARLILVGSNGLDGQAASSPRWQFLAAQGTRVIVLDQSTPLAFQGLPATADTTSFSGRIAFPENPQHPVFNGLAARDFFCWSGNHAVYRHAYRKPTAGGQSLLQCGPELSCSALMEMPVEKGLIVVAQLDFMGKLATDPVAQRLFDNLLLYAAAYAPAETRTALLMADDLAEKRLLDSLGLIAEPVSELSTALTRSASEFKVIVAAATPDTLRELVAKKTDVEAWLQRGGQLMLWNLSDDALADFNTLVNQQHVLRPFRRERVTLPQQRDELLSGLTMRDVVFESSQQIFPWSGDRFPADDAFTQVVDLDDVAPFCKPVSDPYGWGQMTNGLVSADAWVFIHSHNLTSNPEPVWTAELPREEQVTEFSITPNLFYHFIKSIELRFDDRTDDVVVLQLQPKMERQDFAIVPPRTAKKITIKPLAWDAVGSQPVVSVENLWIRTARSPEYVRDVVPLLNIGGLVKYEFPAKRPAAGATAASGTASSGTAAKSVNPATLATGSSARSSTTTPSVGGTSPTASPSPTSVTPATTWPVGAIVLNQLRILDTEQNPINVEKKRTVVSTLLRNMGCRFVARKTFIPGTSAHYAAVPLDDRCNQYLSRDRGWQLGTGDLSLLPVGDQKLAGVQYLIRDFRTSPVPGCIMLGGESAAGKLPDSVDNIPVNRTADEIFFLHTAGGIGDDRPMLNTGDSSAADPVVLQYRIHYADGEQTEVPVHANVEIGPWNTHVVRGAPKASVAWTSVVAADNNGSPETTAAPLHAVVYQFQWTNPRPEVAIEKISVRRIADGHSDVVPVVVAITAATRTNTETSSAPNLRDE